MIRTAMLTDGAADASRPPRGPTRSDWELYPVERRARICGLPLFLDWLIAFSLLALSSSAIPRAAAQGGAEPALERGGRNDTARVHFEAAMEHYRARRYREALRELELSVSEVPSAEVWFDIGRAHEQLGEYALAIESYRRYLRDRVDAPDAQEVARRIEDLVKRSEAARAEPRLRVAPPAALAIDASQPGALVLLDGRELGVGPLDRIVEVVPGRHRLDVSHAGYLPFRAEVEVAPGALSAAYVDMRPLTQPQSGARTRFWTWIAAGTSAAALLASGALGVAALDRRDAGDLDSARRWARASDLALGGGLLLAVAATILYFDEGHRKSAEPAAPDALLGSGMR